MPPGFDPIAIDFRGNGRQIESIEVTVNAPLRDAAMQLWVMRRIGEEYGYPAIGPAPCRQVVFERQTPMTNIPAPPEGPRGTVALSTWSGTLVPNDWEGGCRKALYTVQAEVTPLVPSGFAEEMGVGSAYFTCRLGWWAAAWSNIVPMNDRWLIRQRPASSHVSRRAVMHVIVRSYSGDGASELFDQLEQRNDEIKELIGGVPGFASYTAFRSDDGGGSTVTVCRDKTGTDESSRRAAEWVKTNISATANPPVTTEGGTVAHFSS